MMVAGRVLNGLKGPRVTRDPSGRMELKGLNKLRCFREAGGLGGRSGVRRGQLEGKSREARLGDRRCC